jgi:hypothetical protein
VEPSPERRIAELGAVLLKRLDELSEAMAGRISAAVDGYGDDGLVPIEDLRDTCRLQLDVILRSIASPRAVTVSWAEQNGRQRAKQGVPLPFVMDSYRAAGRYVWETLVAEARTTGLLDGDGLVRAASIVWLILDRFTNAMGVGYRDELTARIVAQEHERSALVEALLEGRITDTHTVWETAELLRISRRGPYAVVAAEVPEVGRHALPGVEEQLRGHDIASAWRLLPDLHLGIVVLPRAEQLQQLVSVLIRDARHRVGVSPMFAGLDGTAEALRLAKIALAGTTSSTALVTVFDDAPMAVAAASAPEVMSRIAQTILGSLNQLPDAERALLLETFEAWRDAGGSSEAAARRLFCHPNTVRHRLRRLAEATGRTLSAPQDVAELCLAVEATRQQPPESAS